MTASNHVTKVALVISEVMNLAALVRRGDDAAWAGIGPDAHLRVVSELMDFVELARGAETSPVGDIAWPEAASAATTLADELMRTGVPVSPEAQSLASQLLASLGVGPEILSALDGD